MTGDQNCCSHKLVFLPKVGCEDAGYASNVAASIVILVGGSAKSIMHALLKTKNKLFLGTPLDTESKPTPNYKFSCSKKCPVYRRFLTEHLVYGNLSMRKNLWLEEISL